MRIIGKDEDARCELEGTRRLFYTQVICFGDALVRLDFRFSPDRCELATGRPPRLDRENLIELHQALAERFDEEELRTLCFYVGVDYDSLTGKGKSGKARELIKHLERRDGLLELIQKIQEVRPDISWGREGGKEVQILWY